MMTWFDSIVESAMQATLDDAELRHDYLAI